MSVATDITYREEFIHICPVLCVSLLKTETAVELEAAKGGVGLGDWEQVKEWLVQDPALVKKYREECEVAYL